MKKVLAMMLAAAMVLSLAACGGKTETTAAPAPETTAAPETQAPETQAPETQAPETQAPETQAPVADKTGTVKIGATGPLTGGAALYGLAAQRGAQIAVDEINAKGGLQFELDYQDDQHDAEKAVNAFNTLLDQGMQVSLGSVTSAPCRATAALAAEEGIFCLTPSASAPAVIEDGQGWEFQVCFSDTNQGSASATYIAEKQLGSKIAIIYKNDEDYSMGIRNSFVAKAGELGLELVGGELTFTADSANDFSVQVAAAKDAGADLLFLPIYYQPASLIITECNKIGYEPTFFGVDGMDGILSMDGFDTQLAEGVILLTPFVADAADDATQNFVAAYQKAWNEIPIQFAADAYDCVYALYEAILASDAEADMDYVEMGEILKAYFTSGFQFTGLTGDNMTWDETGAVTKGPKGMVIQNGVYVGMD